MAVEDEEHGVTATRSALNSTDPRYARVPHAVIRGQTAAAGAGS